MTKDKWIWMPHPGHFICAKDCRFHLNTYVGKYIVSTVGDRFPDSRVRQIYAKSRGIMIEGRGSEWDANYIKKIGFEEIGCGRKYETMVFLAMRAKKDKCCPWTQISGRNKDFDGYNDPEKAYLGHLKMCKKWSVK